MGRNKKKIKEQNAARPASINSKSMLGAFRDAKRPLTRAQLLRRLGGYKKDKRTLKAVLDVLLSQGKIIHTKGGAYALTESMSQTTGRLQVQRSGVGFVIPEDKRRKDIFVSPSNFGNAWDGDLVVVAVAPPRHDDRRGRRPSSGKNVEGRIVRVLERARKTLPVRIRRRLGPDLFLSAPTDPRLVFNVMTDTKNLDTEPEPGDVLHVAPGDKLDNKLWAGSATEFLGQEEDPAVQESLVKANHSIPRVFARRVLDETKGLPANPTEDDFAGRKDLRGLGLVTIDGATAKDFDDAVHVRREKNGWRLTVAIADVSHYVHPGTELDREAKERGNSYYFPQSVEPMFPEALSNGLCSLNPDVPRLAMVAEIFFDAQGQPHDERFYSAVIRSHARLTYSQVQRALDKDSEALASIAPPVMEMLLEAEALAKLLRTVRTARGSLDFDLPEPEILFNLDGTTQDIRPRINTFANQLIEVFMVAANEAVARFLEAKNLPCLYRIHPPPDSDKLRRNFKLLSRTELATSLPRDGVPSAMDIQKVIQAAIGTDLEFLTSRLMLRSMMQATYSPQNEAHFGLGSECYCHFTSPIRRYADLMVHRSLKHALGTKGGPLPRPETMKKIAEHLTACERRATEAEREILKRLTILFLGDRVGEIFTGVINGVSDFGFWVEMSEVMAEGMIRLSSLTDDYYHYLSDRQEIVGERTAKRFALGQTVRVQLVEVNLSRLEVDLKLLDESED